MDHLQVRVAAALKDETSRDYGTNYLDVLTTNWRDAKSTARKTLGLLLIAVAAFELIRSAQLKEATVAGLKISNFANVEKLLPVVVAYLALQLIVLHTTDVYFQRIHSRFHGALHPGLREQRLHVALRPVATIWWEPSTLAYASDTKGAVARLLGHVWSLGTVLATGAFEVFAYLHLFDTYGLNWLVVISLLMSGLLSTRALAELWLESELD